MKIILIGIVDADLIGRKKHRFPNLACMKISGYYKGKGHQVQLLTVYEELYKFDKVFISKVFTDTEVESQILEQPNVIYGGTGFFFDKAPPLSEDIEHHMPDYHLYDEWVAEKVKNGVKEKEFTYYKDYSIGFLTRGCFRGCSFCVNKNCKKSVRASPIQEFLDLSRPKICLQDDNFFACADSELLLQDLKAIGKKFQFKQGLDERLLTKEKIQELFSCQTEGDLIFAFDNIEDKNIIQEKLEMIKMLYPENKKTIKFYTLCGFDRNDIWNDAFWQQDIIDVFKRIKILMEYKCIPYITRFDRYKESRYRGMYINLARWCNQPQFFKKKSYREFCEVNGMKSACYQYMCDFQKVCPDIQSYYDMKF